MGALGGLVDKGLMAPDWAEALAPVDERIAAMGAFLREEVAAGRGYQPNGESVFRAFERPLAEVRVLIVGQDPYPNPEHPIGLSFAVRRDVWPLPPSLVNIYTELRDDLDIMPPRHGDLTAWADQGVMLLNRSLTVQPGASRTIPCPPGRPREDENDASSLSWPGSRPCPQTAAAAIAATAAAAATGTSQPERLRSGRVPPAS
jgi:uracil-DNA glycosylase